MNSSASRKPSPLCRLRSSLLSFSLTILSLGVHSEPLIYYDPDHSREKAQKLESSAEGSLIVDPGKIVSTIPERFFGINIHPGTTKFEINRIDLLRQLKPDAIRIMTNLRTDWIPGRGRELTPLSPKRGEFSWNELDLLIRSTMAVGAEPYLALGFGPPQWLSSASNAIDRRAPPPENHELYADFMASIAKRYALEKKWPIRRLTIENEPENSGYTYENYTDLYRAAYSKIKKVAPALEIGGAATGYANWPQPNGKSLSFSAVATSLKSDNVPLDFFDWHIYSTSEEAVLKTAQTAKRIFGEDKKLVISELNRDWRYSREHQRISEKNNTSWDSLAWLAKTYDELQALGVDQVFYFGWRENTLGLINSASTELRPNYFLISAITNFLGRQRVQTESSINSIGSIGTIKNGDFVMLIYNTSSRDVSLEISGVEGSVIFEFDKSVYEANRSADQGLRLLREVQSSNQSVQRKTSARTRIPAGGFVIWR